MIERAYLNAKYLLGTEEFRSFCHFEVDAHIDRVVWDDDMKMWVDPVRAMLYKPDQSQDLRDYKMITDETRR